MEETKEKQSRAVHNEIKRHKIDDYLTDLDDWHSGSLVEHHEVVVYDYLTDPDDWQLILGSYPYGSNEVKMARQQFYGGITSTGQHTTSGLVKKEEHDEALTRIKELEADKGGILWERTKKAEERIRELEADKGFLDRANILNWERVLAARETIKDIEETIKDLEEKNKWLIATVKRSMPTTKISDNNGNLVEVKSWDEEYGWTQHIFDPLDNNPLLGCKKWIA